MKLDDMKKINNLSDFSKIFFVIMLFALLIVFTGCSSKGGNTGSDLISGKSVATSSVCEDSDKGIFENVKGTATLGDSSKTDKCYDSFLVEYYCKDNTIKSKNFNCENGCTDGKCN